VTASHKDQRSATLFKKKNGVMETGTNPHPTENTQRASQEAFFVSRGFAKRSMAKPLSTFPPAAATVQQLLALSAVGFFGYNARERRPPNNHFIFLSRYNLLH
jgi:hypothetical protein